MHLCGNASVPDGRAGDDRIRLDAVLVGLRCIQILVSCGAIRTRASDCLSLPPGIGCTFDLSLAMSIQSTPGVLIVNLSVVVSEYMLTDFMFLRWALGLQG